MVNKILIRSLLLFGLCIEWSPILAAPALPDKSSLTEAPLPQLPRKSVAISYLSQLLTKVFKELNIKETLDSIQEGETSKHTAIATCHICKFGFSVLQHLFEFGVHGSKITQLVDTVCTRLHIETAEVCNGVVNTFKNEFVSVFANLSTSPSEICGVILGDSCSHIESPLYNWTIPMTIFPKPPVAPKVPVKNVTKTMKILHISDTHVDPRYIAGSNAECNEPLCCRKDTSVAYEQKSGFWGDYRNCDIPQRTFEQMLKFISIYHKDIDYVIWTGDIPPHDIWQQTREGQIKLINETSALLAKHLGSIPIFPALGNHESAPVNSFPPEFIKGNESINWLYSDLQKIWMKWLPSGTINTVNKGAYYSLKIRSNLKLISMNMNYCNNQNWWLLLNSTDPTGELEWLVNELQASELLNEKVHIIGHIAPGLRDCLHVWSENYYRIINRYESTVVAQFFGHTHHDEFEVFYDETNASGHLSDARATNLAFITPSVTTFNYVNPGYRIYTVDDTKDSSHFVLDHETFFMNLTEANRNPNKPLHWKSSYKALSDFGLKSMEPQEWHNLVIRMISDEKLFQKFYTYFFNRSDYARINKECKSEDCKMKKLCRLVTGKSFDSKYCDQLAEMAKRRLFYSIVN